jgi:hypothetical protein
MIHTPNRGLVMAHECRACGHDVTPYRTLAVRGKPTDLFTCPSCGLYEFPEPDWLDEAYRDPIAQIDVGLVSRCLIVSRIVETLVRSLHLQNRALLDFGGGYGLLTRLVRDAGLDMRHHDPLAANLFAQELDGDPSGDYALCTLIEVFEHLDDPRGVLDRLRHIDLLLITTELVPDPLPDDWPYLIPDLGQHVTFYSPRALSELARRYGYALHSDGFGVHLMYRGRLPRTARLALRKHRLAALSAAGLRQLQGGRTLRDQDAASIGTGTGTTFA